MNKWKKGIFFFVKYFTHPPKTWNDAELKTALTVVKLTFNTVYSVGEKWLNNYLDKIINNLLKIKSLRK